MKNKKCEKSGNKTKILIVDDHPVVRQGLKQLINHEPDLVVSAEAENADQALELLEQKLVNLAIVDVTLNGINGIQLTEKIKSRYPDLPVLVLTIHDEEVYGKLALEAGAKGYLNKREAAETVIFAIHSLLRGEQYFSEKRTGDALKAL